MSKRRWRAGAGFVALGAAGALLLSSSPSIAAPPPQGSSGSSGPAARTQMGTGTFKGTVDLSKLPPAAPHANAQAPAVNRTPNKGGDAKDAPILPPTGAAPAVAAPSPLLNLDGVNNDTNNDVIPGLNFAPPDQALCVGGGLVLEAVNSVFQFYDTSGNAVLPAFPLFDLFDESNTIFLINPRCVYDPATNTFFATISAKDFSGPGFSTLDVAVIPVSNISNVENYYFNTTDNANTNCPCSLDQPTLGLDSQNVYVSGDEFPLFGGPYPGAELLAISKSQLVAQAPNPSLFQAFGLSDAGHPVLGLQAATTSSPSNVEFFVHSFVVADSSFSLIPTDHRLGVMALEHPEAVSAGNFPILTGFVTTNVATYAQPIPAKSTGGQSLASFDDRAQGATFLNGQLWTALDTVAVVGPNRALHDAGLAIQLTPVITATGTLQVRGERPTPLWKPGADVLYPAVTPSPTGSMAAVFTLTSQTLNPSSGFAVGVGKPGPVTIATTGFAPYADSISLGCVFGFCPWGEYSATAVDPSTNNIWLATEYVPPPSSQGQKANWGTNILEFGH